MTIAQFGEIAPVFPVRNLARALEHYEQLGFHVQAFEGPAPYGFARRGRVQLHLSLVADLDPAAGNSAAYLYVDDADALAGEWQRSGAGGRWVEPTDTDYGLREGAHVDLDGNLIRYGSPL